jgi:hypothetical protein
MSEGWSVRPPMSAGTVPLTLRPGRPPQICLPKNNRLLERQPRGPGQHNERQGGLSVRQCLLVLYLKHYCLKFAYLRTTGFLKDSLSGPASTMGDRVVYLSANVGRFLTSKITPRKNLPKYAYLRTTGFLKVNLGGPASTMGDRVVCSSANVGRFFTFNITASNMLT